MITTEIYIERSLIIEFIFFGFQFVLNILFNYRFGRDSDLHQNIHKIMFFLIMLQLDETFYKFTLLFMKNLYKKLQLYKQLK